MNKDPLIATSINKLFRAENRQLAPMIISIVQSLREYWPLTIRQVYYQAVAKMLIENMLKQYQRVSRMLTKLRENDLLPWHAFEDRSRRTIEKAGVSDLQTWAKLQIDEFMNYRYYHRCRVQSQGVYVEIATEKDALASIIENSVWQYCTRINVIRGQCSATLVEQIASRYSQAAMRGQELVMVYLGDLGPSGVAIPRSIIRRLREYGGVNVELYRAALNPEQVVNYSLPGDPEAAKDKDPNYKRWLKEYGGQAPVELDALHPQVLSEITVAALQRFYDMEEFQEQEQRELGETKKMAEIKRDAEDYLYANWPEVFCAAR